ncbi:PREDICTED: protein N-lysine methyltransferase METTL21A isoform X2 [Nelumbo nucifera]|uniref:Protein N-lysine methyltransferase METTL21A isoform X2 n=1 Tax=Nelumbo nucifera TaxID=4432 RepID=A0A1U7ZC08_NELNU|nr:PREDICTED: protein N-lysine methyltransferase METTL21A isoform X2 [Nelumbo nucifera]
MCVSDMVESVVGDVEAEAAEDLVLIGSYETPIRLVRDSAEEILLLWAIQQPTLCKQNAFVRQSSLLLDIEACGHRLTIFQSPSSMSTPGVTGAVMWDSGVVLGKFLEHAVDSGRLVLQGKKVVELGSGCGLVGCIAAMLGGQVTLTDLPDRLRLLRKNVEANVIDRDVRGSATVSELIWGDDPDSELIEPLPDYVLGSDVIYSEGAVADLLVTLRKLCGAQTTILLVGELRNGFHNWACGSNTVASRLSQQSSCDSCFSKKKQWKRG